MHIVILVPCLIVESCLPTGIQQKGRGGGLEDFANCLSTRLCSVLLPPFIPSLHFLSQLQTKAALTAETWSLKRSLPLTAGRMS